MFFLFVFFKLWGDNLVNHLMLLCFILLLNFKVCDRIRERCEEQFTYTHQNGRQFFFFD